MEINKIHSYKYSINDLYEQEFEAILISVSHAIDKKFLNGKINSIAIELKRRMEIIHEIKL